METKITKIEIKHLWQNPNLNLEWQLNSDVNVLGGINGSGKSTVFSIIYNSLKPQNNDIKEFIANKFDEAKIYFGENNCFINSDKNTDKYRKIFDNFYCPIVYIKNFDTNLKTIEAVQKLSNSQVKTELDWELYQLQQKYLEYQVNIDKQRDFIIENNKNYREEFIKIKEPQKKFTEIINLLFQETAKQINNDQILLSFTLNDKEISPYQLSTGEKQILIILLSVLIQDNKPFILLIDEPETSLHIDWQEQLIENILKINKNTQIIIATHSPYIIAQGWGNKVFQFENLIKVK